MNLQKLENGVTSFSKVIDKQPMLSISIGVASAALIGLLTGSLVFMTVSIGVACAAKVALSKNGLVGQLLQKCSVHSKMGKILAEFAVALCAGMQVAFYAQLALGIVSFNPLFLGFHLVGTAALCAVAWSATKQAPGAWKSFKELFGA